VEPLFRQSVVLLTAFTEFMLADLALAAHGIPSFTLSSLSLLSEVLELHPPSAIITHGTFLPQLLELIYDSAEGEHHKVIVLGDTTSASRVENAMLFQWNEVERTGSQGPVVEPARLGTSPIDEPAAQN
jgi:long-chain acyl-CoA synthetase